MSRVWMMKKLLEDVKKGEGQTPEKTAAKSLWPEFERLAVNKCAYCSGWGHSAKDCPTDAKISHLRGGVKEQNRYLQQLRKTAR